MGLWTAVIVFGALFAVSFAVEKRRIRNAAYLLLFLCSLLGAVVSGMEGASGPATILLFLLMAALVLVLPVVSVMFVWCGVTAIRKEGLRLPNVLSILFPVVMWGSLVFVVWAVTVAYELPAYVLYMAALVAMLGVYVAFTFIALFLYSTLYRILPKRTDFDFIIIHGAGLMSDGRPTPLLAGRCDKAFDLFEKGGRTARIVVSGGKGGDEVCSEAQSMHDYLVEKGVPDEQILLEDKSTSTMTNMRNSKAIIDETSAALGIPKPRCVFVTSDFHVLRTATYARRVGLKADGVGSRTARYYFPNAFIREYVALMVGHKGPIVAIVCLWGLCAFVSSMNVEGI